MSLVMLPEGLSENDLPWYEHRHVNVIDGISPLQTQTHHPYHSPLLSIIIFIVFFLSAVIIIIAGASGCWFASMGMVVHGLCIGGEVVKVAGAQIRPRWQCMVHR